MSEHETIYKKLGTKFDYYFFESETGKLGKEIVEKNVGDIVTLKILHKGTEKTVQVTLETAKDN